jgi:deoxyribonuclease V
LKSLNLETSEEENQLQNMPSPLVLYHQHPWDLSPSAARQIQDDLRQYVLTEPLPIHEIQSVAGVDVSYQDDIACAAVVVFQFPGLRLLEEAAVIVPLTIPYIPGLLSFRELPGILAALEQLQGLPDVLLVDGHGLAHPRRFGLACHLGVLLDLPAIGCAKSILLGEVEALGNEVSSKAELISDGEVLGVALRTRLEVKPVYVSIGHRVDLDSTQQIILACGRGFRLPEPLRRAHIVAKKTCRAQ